MKMKNFLAISLLAFSTLTMVSCKPDNSSSVEEPCTQTFKVTYYLNDGTSSVYKEVETEVNKTVTHPTNPTREGYDFEGWYVDDDCLVSFSNSTKITANTSLYAKWELGEVNPNTSDSAGINPSNSANSSSPSNNSSAATPLSVTYTIDSLPDWITNDGCGIFAWVWSDTNTGEWIATTYDSSNTANIKVTFTVDEEITGMLLVRTIAGTTTPNWQQKAHEAGRIYNQTENITVVAGQTTYSCASWKEYNPS